MGKLGTSSSSSSGGEQNLVYITADPKNYHKIKKVQKKLKKYPTRAESTLWLYLKNKSTGHKIRRQHIIQSFIVDFVCLKKQVVIEVDGKIHERQKEYDRARTEILNRVGFKVIRFTNDEVLASPQLIAEKIKHILNTYP